MRKLTGKQKRFVEEYLIDLNATQAAIRAGYSAATAKDIGCENLAKPNISEAISIAMAERSCRTGISQDRVLQELAKIAFADITDMIDLKNAKPKERISRDDTAAIQSIKVKKTSTGAGETEEREIKVADKLRALELLGKHLGMYQNNVNVSLGTSEKLADVIKQLSGQDEKVT